MRDTIDMAREAGASRSHNPELWDIWQLSNKALKDFEVLVRADERDKWMERAHIMILGEREACAKVCDRMAARCNDIRAAALESAAENIRARGNT
jgi:hypothetical protein